MIIGVADTRYIEEAIPINLHYQAVIKNVPAVSNITIFYEYYWMIQ